MKACWKYVILGWQGLSAPRSSSIPTGWSLCGIEHLNCWWVLTSTTRRSICGQWLVYLPNLFWENLCFAVSQKWTKLRKYSQFWETQLIKLGLSIQIWNWLQNCNWINVTTLINYATSSLWGPVELMIACFWVIVESTFWNNYSR